MDKPAGSTREPRADRAAGRVKKIWYVFRLGREWDGPHFVEHLADAACLRARHAGYTCCYVERTQ